MWREKIKCCQEISTMIFFILMSSHFKCPHLILFKNSAVISFPKTWYGPFYVLIYKFILFLLTKKWAYSLKPPVVYLSNMVDHFNWSEIALFILKFVFLLSMSWYYFSMCIYVHFKTSERTRGVWSQRLSAFPIRWITSTGKTNPFTFSFHVGNWFDCGFFILLLKSCCFI